MTLPHKYSTTAWRAYVAGAKNRKQSVTWPHGVRPLDSRYLHMPIYPFNCYSYTIHLLLSHYTLSHTSRHTHGVVPRCWSPPAPKTERPSI